MNNLLEIRPDFSEQEILAALEKVGLQKFIDQSPNGVATNLSSNKLGYNLGFRKRLALGTSLSKFGKLDPYG